MQVRGVATSVRTEEQARGLGIPLTDFASVTGLDLAIDGADEVEAGTLRLIKGLGGALLREKIVAEAARRFVVVADASKVVKRLGEHAPVPVEVARFGHEMTARRLSGLAGRPVLRRGADGAPFVTDNGNLIYDCHIGPIGESKSLDIALGSIAGVVGHGLFLEGVEQAIIGEPDESDAGDATLRVIAERPEPGEGTVQQDESGSGRTSRKVAPVWAELPDAISKPVVAVVMGVSGSGKTTVAALLAAAMHWHFQEGDDLHPAANVEKMRSGHPLNDADRLPWLHAIAGVIDRWRADGEIRGADVLRSEARLSRSDHRRAFGCGPGVSEGLPRGDRCAHGGAT